MNDTFSQKVSSSILATSATSISPPLPEVNPLIPKSYIRLVCFVESPYDNESDPYKVATQILPPGWNFVPKHPLFTQAFYQHILKDTKSVEFETTPCKFDSSRIGFSKFTIRRIISPKEWGPPWTLRALSESFSNIKTISYYDYIDAWTYTLFFENNNHRHTWFIRFKGFHGTEPIPHWFLQWWDRFGPDEKLFPESLKKAYDQWAANPHDTPSLDKYPAMKNPPFKNIPVLLRFHIQFNLVPWIFCWKFVFSHEDNVKILAQKFFIKWWPVYTTDPIIAAIAKAKTQIATHPQFLAQRSQLQAKLAAAQSKDDYKNQLLEVLSQLSQEDEANNVASTSSTALSPIPQYQDAQDPYDGYEVHLSDEEINAINQQFF
jgi:hypothetical protein